jgi:hypothetical protein
MAVETIIDKEYNFPNFKKGDSFAKGGKVFQFQVTKSDGTAPDATLSTVRIVFRKINELETIIKDISNGSGITVTDATNWIFEIDIFTIDWDPLTYVYDTETTDSNGVIDTVLSGQVIIEQDVTYT